MNKLRYLRIVIGAWILVLGARIADVDLDCDCDTDHDELAWEDCGEEGCCA